VVMMTEFILGWIMGSGSIVGIFILIKKYEL
jgi:hypothetical protein